ncbi:sigma-70 family RNA polymerase sigma factor [Kitasatospora sp. NPDC047058]|uniref:RNA polymerase sigma factor n=1 Tax=Kitasatospora sp. NPDC047058 TaxID=3155620 RepID=UPI0033E2A647
MTQADADPEGGAVDFTVTRSGQQLPYEAWPPAWQSTFWAFHRQVRTRYLEWAYLQLGSDADAEDAVDATFDSLTDKWGQMLQMENLKGYAWKVLKHRVIDQARRQGRRAQPMDTAAFEAAMTNMSHDPFEDLAEAMAAYHELRRLPERQRDVMELCSCLGFTTQEAAALMGVERATVRSHMRQARQRLAARLREDSVEGTDGEKQ